jgi:hypothetical protein
MTRRVLLVVVVAGLVGSVFLPDAEAQGLGTTARTQLAVAQGLDWLANQQAADGRWAATGGRYPVAVTSLAGLALLAEGSTPGQGRYGKQLDAVLDYLLRRCQADGLIGNPLDLEER